MYRQSASRSHRSKGFKVKHVLQICVLVAVCFWLIYQVTRSNDKKKEFDHNDVKISEGAQKDDEVLKFGRKDLNPQVNKKAKDTEKHDEEVEEEDEKHEEEIVEEEDKHEEEEQKEDHETQKKGIESREGGNDEEDEHNQEKPDPEVDREELIDDEKEIEEEGEKESEEKDIEDNDSRQTENENSLEDHDHDKEIRNTREEHYKGDDASSAVTHGLPVNTENENGSEENHVNIVDHENKGNITEESFFGQNTTDFKLQETTESGTLTVDDKGDDVDPPFEGSSSLNSATALGSDDKPESRNDSIISDTSYSENVTVGTVPAEGSNFQSLPLEQTDNSSIVVDNNSQLDLNLTTSNASDNVEENTNSVTNSHLVASEYPAQSNVSAETKDHSESHSTEVKTDARTDGDNERSDSNNTENTDDVQRDNFDSSESSIPLDEKGIHVDLDTLPDIRTEGSNSEEAAEE